MLSSPSLSIGIIAAISATVAAQPRCHLESWVQSEQISACGSGSCIPSSVDQGGASLFIAGAVVWSGGDYGTMSNGGGVDFDAEGVVGHVSSLGIPQSGNPPNCKVTLGDYENLGIGSSDSWGLPGTSGMSMECIHDWDC